MRRVLLLLLPVLMVGGVGAGTALLRIDTITVEGFEALSPEVVVEASRLQGDERMLVTRLAPVQRRLEAIPEIATATVRRAFPRSFVLTIREREPVARLGGQRGLVVDAHGVQFSDLWDGPLPELVGWEGTTGRGHTVDRFSRAFLRAVPGFPDRLRQAAEFRTGPRTTVVLASGVEVRFGVPDDLVAKARAAVLVLDEVEAAGRDIGYVDVRAPSVPVTGATATPTPSPQATDPSGATPSPAATAAPTPDATAPPATTPPPSAAP